MPVKLDHRGWTAAQHLALCVVCHQPAILRSPRSKACHWPCAVAWVNEHQDDKPGRRAPEEGGRGARARPLRHPRTTEAS
jgi:hypothetical protein